MPRSAEEILHMAETVADTWFPSVVQVDGLLSELYALSKIGHVVDDVIDELLDYRLTRVLEEKYRSKAG